MHAPTLAVLCVLLAAPAGAAATPAIAVDPGAPASRAHEPPPRLVFEATAMMSIATLGEYSAVGWGPQLLVGRRYGEITVLGYGSVFEMQATDMPYGAPHAGTVFRAGTGARLSVFTARPDRSLEIDFGFEVDVERRFVRWASGGAVDRTAVTGGLILNMALGPRDRARRALHYGIRMGAADGPGAHQGLDLVALFELGMHWSR